MVARVYKFRSDAGSNALQNAIDVKTTDFILVEIWQKYYLVTSTHRLNQGISKMKYIAPELADF